MFIFILNGATSTLLNQTFTFHYVYIYMMITLTLHFLRYLDLHSTMFIFILASVKNMDFNKVIYIPLCLYLYLQTCTPQFSLLYLHSTMFIFICRGYRECEGLHTFTFHYVYIYIASSASDVRRISVFTFHYVYIYMAVATWNS